MMGLLRTVARHISHPGYDKTRYRIMCHESYDEYGNVERIWYTIEQYMKKWFKMRWRPLQHTDYSWGDCNTVTTTFKTKELAKEMIHKLEEGGLRDTMNSYEVL